MSRVERIEASPSRRAAAQPRRSDRNRSAVASENNLNSTRTPGKAEGERKDVEEALTREQE